MYRRSVKINKPVKYEISVYVPDLMGKQFTGSFVKGACIFCQVASRDKVIDVVFMLDDEQPGWISLEIYDFNEGKYSVFLNDKGGDKIGDENG